MLGDAWSSLDPGVKRMVVTAVHFGDTAPEGADFAGPVLGLCAPVERLLRDRLARPALAAIRNRSGCDPDRWTLGTLLGRLSQALDDGPRGPAAAELRRYLDSTGTALLPMGNSFRRSILCDPGTATELRIEDFSTAPSGWRFTGPLCLPTMHSCQRSPERFPRGRSKQKQLDRNSLKWAAISGVVVCLAGLAERRGGKGGVSPVSNKITGEASARVGVVGRSLDPGCGDLSGQLG